MAIQSGRRLVVLEPLSEAGQRALMRAYADGGRRGEALRQYKSCVDTLRRELGVMPDEETQALARSIARSGGEADIPTGPAHQALTPSTPTTVSPFSRIGAFLKGGKINALDQKVFTTTEALPGRPPGRFLAVAATAA